MFQAHNVNVETSVALDFLRVSRISRAAHAAAGHSPNRNLRDAQLALQALRFKYIREYGTRCLVRFGSRRQQENRFFDLLLRFQSFLMSGEAWGACLNFCTTFALLR